MPTGSTMFVRTGKTGRVWLTKNPPREKIHPVQCPHPECRHRWVSAVEFDLNRICPKCRQRAFYKIGFFRQEWRRT